MPRMTESESAGPPEVVGAPGDKQADEPQEAVISPAKVMRIGAMVRQLLEEVRQAPLDQAGRARLAEIYELSIRELASSLSPELADELRRVALPLNGDGQDGPSEAELRIAQAQLVGWLEGLFHGIQASLFAQQMQARGQLAEMRGRQLPSPMRTAEDTGQGQYL
jgi:proteasome activator-like protein